MSAVVLALAQNAMIADLVETTVDHALLALDLVDLVETTADHALLALVSADLVETTADHALLALDLVDLVETTADHALLALDLRPSAAHALKAAPRPVALSAAHAALLAQALAAHPRAAVVLPAAPASSPAVNNSTAQASQFNRPNTVTSLLVPT
jgi:hypothetical protein